MKIYVVTHFYNNGESYEDYREDTDYYMFSTKDKAYAFYCDKILSEYEGQYSMYEKELDTQEQTLLEVSPWVKCTPWYEDEEYQCDPEPYYDDVYDPEEDYYPWGEPKHPESSIERAWDYLDWLESEREECDEEEQQSIIEEYLNSEGTNYKEYKAIEEDLLRRKEAMMINANPDYAKCLHELAELLGIQFNSEEQ